MTEMERVMQSGETGPLPAERIGRWTWRQHDVWWQERNAEYLARARDESLPTDRRLLAMWAHGREEEARLVWKEAEMLQEKSSRT